MGGVEKNITSTAGFPVNLTRFGHRERERGGKKIDQEGESRGTRTYLRDSAQGVGLPREAATDSDLCVLAW